MSEALRRLARAYGIEDGYHAEGGGWHETSDETRRAMLSAMSVLRDGQVDASALPEPPEIEAEAPVAARAYQPEWLETTRAWGFTCQLYSLRSRRNWGIGDLEDLGRLAEIAAARGADFVGINPLHALFPDDPGRFSPYAPSTRQFLNPLYLAPDRVPEYEQLGAERIQAAERVAAQLRTLELVDYPAVAEAKYGVLETMFEIFRALPRKDTRRRAFDTFRRRHGQALERHCLYEALARHFARQGGSVAWSQWPAAYRDPDSPEVAAFAADNTTTIAYYAWLQWLTELQLAEVQARALAAGMRIGLYLDIAVGVAPDGAMTWAEPHDAIAEAEIGAPPDALAAGGQQWGLAPLCPARLKQTNLAAFRRVLAATMRHSGAARIDHAMGLQRLFWIPKGKSAADGAYIRYPVADMFAAVAEESHKFRCLVIGEDLGTVPEGFRDTMRNAGLFAYRVLYFERGEDQRFRRSDDHIPDALICVSTHDLPTLKGWWAGRDIEWRAELGLVSPDEARRQHEERARDRNWLLEALQAEGLRPEEAGSEPPLHDAALIAIHRFVARAPCRLLAVQLDDAVGVMEQANVPGTTEEHPNWRRRLPVEIEELENVPLFNSLTAAVAQERPRS